MKGNPNLIEVNDKITTDFIRIRIAPCSWEQRVRGEKETRESEILCVQRE